MPRALDGRLLALPFLAGALGLGLLPLAGPAAAQDFLFAVEGQVGGLTLTAHEFGFRDGAATGLDAWDVPEPPLPPAAYAALSFRMLAPPLPIPNRYWHDIRAGDDFRDQVEVWELHLESDRLGAECSLAFSQTAGAPTGLALRVLGPWMADWAEVPLGGTLAFPVTGWDTPLWVELTSDRPVAAEPVTWSRVKRLFAR
jgi:hypothetical protein